MGGWIVSRTIDDQEPINYKFTPKFVLRGGQSVTVGKVYCLSNLLENV